MKAIDVSEIVAAVVNGISLLLTGKGISGAQQRLAVCYVRVAAEPLKAARQGF